LKAITPPKLRIISPQIAMFDGGTTFFFSAEKSASNHIHLSNL